MQKTSFLELASFEEYDVATVNIQLYQMGWRIVSFGNASEHT
jgi:hypothetical protein